ncbi:MAG: DegV family protein [Syntrophomonas sp.]
MAKIVITDSTAYLPSSFIEQHGIKIVPLNIHVKGQVYKEGIDLANREYFNLLRREPIFPQTSQPSSGDFLRVFSSLKAGDEALVLLISSGISGTAQAALMTREMLARPELKINIIDSRSTAIGLGFQVMKACELISQGWETDFIVREIQSVQQRNRFYFLVDDLEYLARGGRISHKSKQIGNILQIKPVLHIKDGRIEVFQKIRTRHKALNLLVEELDKKVEQVEKVALAHVDAADRLEELTAAVRTVYDGPLIVNEVGPVIGTHVGPGAVGVAFY